MMSLRASNFRRYLQAVVCAGGLAALVGAVAAADRFPNTTLSMDARKYLHLVDALERLSPESVDYRIGRALSDGQANLTYGDIVFRGTTLATHLESVHARSSSHRAASLIRETRALVSRGAMLTGRRPTFDEELQSLFDVNVRDVLRDASPVQSLAAETLDRRLPGDGPLASRLAAYQRRFTIPRGHLHSVITRAVAICRARTREFIELPGGEALDVEYIAERPWSAYTFYRGNFRSVMQVNRAMPLTIAQALNLGCHEGYPGHHTINVLRDQEYVRERGFTESNALLVFSPEGFRAEALATAGAVSAFSAEERARIYATDLFPLAGLDPRDARDYGEVVALVEQLDGMVTHTVTRYLTGNWTRTEAESALMSHALNEHPGPLLDYLDRYGAYGLAYTWGRDRVLAELTNGGLAESERWNLLKGKLTSPGGVAFRQEPSSTTARISPALHPR